MIKIVLDTNIIVSGLNFPGSKPAEVLKLVAKRHLINYISAFIIKETAHVLSRKFLWRLGRVKRAESWLKKSCVVIQPEVKISVISDDSDNRILECAVCGQTEYIITGDRHLLNLKKCRGVKIMTPSDFLEMIYAW